VLPVAASVAPRVVVGVPALHSLVAALTQGGIELGLLMGPGTTPAAALDDLQKVELLAADMIIWVGPDWAWNRIWARCSGACRPWHKSPCPRPTASHS